MIFDGGDKGCEFCDVDDPLGGGGKRLPGGELGRPGGGGPGGGGGPAPPRELPTRDE